MQSQPEATETPCRAVVSDCVGDKCALEFSVLPGARPALPSCQHVAEEKKEFFWLKDAALKSQDEQGRNGLVCAESSLRR